MSYILELFEQLLITLSFFVFPDSDLLRDLAHASIAQSKLESLVAQQRKDIDHALKCECKTTCTHVDMHAQTHTHAPYNLSVKCEASHFTDRVKLTFPNYLISYAIRQECCGVPW